MSVIEYFIKNIGLILKLTIEHIEITLIAVAISTVIGVAIGIFITRHQRAAGAIIGIAGILYTIPSLALFGILIPFIGIGLKPTLIALILYSQLALIRNTFVGIIHIDPSIREAGKGMGMSNWQFLRMVEIPVALPVIMAGIRTAAVMNIGTATIAAYIGAGGLGWLIFRGIASVNSDQIIAGAVPVILLAVGVDYLFILLERALTPAGLRN
ncbi:MAG: ABC transporter permease [Syntrophales bacterium]|nr:ABC transporter permease [Syntrophales bacterium]MDP3096572.1 ABC transporter permease [Syntrophales bacterium]